jgi:hypothetical protein
MKSVSLLLFIMFILNLIGTEVRAQGERVPFERDGRWGYRDEKGNVIIQPQFVIANEFSPEGIAAVVDGKGWAYIDKKGDIVIRPFIFDNGPDYFQEGVARFTANNKFGFFNKKGEIVVKPQFDFAEPFSEGLAVICIGCQQKLEGEHFIVQGGKWGYVNRKGKVVISPQFESARPFEQGKAQVKSKGKWMEIDRSGRILGKSSKREGARMEFID